MLRAARLNVACVAILLLTGGEVAAAILAGPITLNNGDNYSLDLNGDGHNDFLFSVTAEGPDERAHIAPIIEFDAPTTPSVAIGLNGFVKIFAAGSPINGESFLNPPGSKPQKQQFNIYNDLVAGSPFAEVGASGFIALSLSQHPPKDSPKGTPGRTFFGFAEITRGSLTVEDTGFEDTPDTPIFAGAESSAVPEPSSLTLFAVAAVGFAVYYLRRKQAT